MARVPLRIPCQSVRSLGRAEVALMDPNLPSPSKPGRKPLPPGVATVVFVAIFLILTFLLGRSMVEHRFFQGGRIHENGSIGQ